MLQVRHCVCMHVPRLIGFLFSFSFPYTPEFTISIPSHSFFPHFIFPVFEYFYSIMSRNANDANVGPALQSSGVKKTSRVGVANAAIGARVIDIEIDRRVPSW